MLSHLAPKIQVANICIQVQQKNLVSMHSIQQLFSRSLCLLVSQTGLVSKPKSEGFGLAGQFPITKRGMKLNFSSRSSFKKK